MTNASPRVQAMQTTQDNNVKLANLLSSSGGRHRRRRTRINKRTCKHRRPRRHRFKSRRRGGAVVQPLANSELYNANATNAGLVSISNQNTANMQYDNVSLITK